MAGSLDLEPAGATAGVDRERDSRRRAERDARRDRSAGIAAIALPCAVALALCLIQLGDRSLGFDEGASLAIAAQHGHALWSAIGHDGGNMSAFYLLLHLLITWLGDGILTLRILSVIATVAGVAALAALAMRLFERRVALAAGLLSGCSLPLVFWAQSARGYALMVACLSASCLSFVILADRATERRSTLAPCLAYVVFTTAAIYCGFVAALVIPAQLLSLTVRRRALRPAALGVLGTLALCVPLLLVALHRGSGQLFWVPKPTFSATLQIGETLTSAGLRPSFHLTAVARPLLVLTLLMLIAGAAELMGRRWRARGEREAWAGVLLVSWLLAPFVLALVESAVGQSIFLPRNLLSSLPAVALVLAWLLFAGGLPALAGWAGLAVLLVLRLLTLAPTYGVSPEAWSGAARYVVAHARPGDCIAFYPSDGRMAFGYYLNRDAGAGVIRPRPILPAVPWSELRPYVEDYATLSATQVQALPAACPRLWLVVSHEGQSDGPQVSRDNLSRYHALQAALQRRYDTHSSVTLGYAAAIKLELCSATR